MSGETFPQHFTPPPPNSPPFKLLVLLGVPIRRQDFPSSIPGVVAFDLLQPRRQLHAWVEDEVSVHDVFVKLVLGCGVHHKEALTRGKGKGEGEGATAAKRRHSTGGCGGKHTAGAGAKGRRGAPCHLAKLRGGAQTEVRMLVAACLGVRTSAAEIRRLRNAREELRSLPPHPRVRPPSPFP